MEKQEPFEIGGEKIRPGSRRVIRIPISMFPDHPAFFLSLYVIHGKLPGKTLFVSSTIHGDELNGIAVVKHVISSNHTKNLKGTLILAPVVNMIGALIKSRYLADRRDLNRSFPGIEKGSQASQLAYTFFHEVVKKSTHGIDIHTGSDNRINQYHGYISSPLRERKCRLVVRLEILFLFLENCDSNRDGQRDNGFL